MFAAASKEYSSAKTATEFTNSETTYVIGVPSLPGVSLAAAHDKSVKRPTTGGGLDQRRQSGTWYEKSHCWGAKTYLSDTTIK